MNSLAAKLLLLSTTLFFCAGVQAGPFPKFLKQIPDELQGEYLLLARMNPDKTHEEFTTNAPPFATILSNRVILANGTVRTLDTVIQVTEKGTNVHMISFKGKITWLVAPGNSPSELSVIEPNVTKPKAPAPIYLLRRKTETNPSPKPGLLRKATSSSAGASLPTESRHQD